tara:strand:- start:18442 stop:19059 length:618 start_codon:yes stop_codon:yes gene_type:complete
MAFENSIQVLQDFAKKQIKDIKKNLKGSSGLVGSIKASVKGNFDKEPKVVFQLPKYAGFVDTGVEGTGEGQKKDKDGNLTKYSVIKKKTLNNSFANALFGFRKQPAFSGDFKMIPTNAIDKWVVRKGLEGTRDEKTGRFISRKSLKFAIATSIYQKGIGQGGKYPSLAGKGFFSKPLKSNFKTMAKDLADAYTKDLINNFKDEIV